MIRTWGKAVFLSRARFNGSSVIRPILLFLLEAVRDLCSSLHSVCNVKYLEHMPQVIFNGKYADIQNAGNLQICFAHFHPLHNFYFTLAQAEVFVFRKLICK